MGVTDGLRDHVVVRDLGLNVEGQRASAADRHVSCEPGDVLAFAQFQLRGHPSRGRALLDFDPVGGPAILQDAAQREFARVPEDAGELIVGGVRIVLRRGSRAHTQDAVAGGVVGELIAHHHIGPLSDRYVRGLRLDLEPLCGYSSRAC